MGPYHLLHRTCYIQPVFEVTSFIHSNIHKGQVKVATAIAVPTKGQMTD